MVLVVLAALASMMVLPAAAAHAAPAGVFGTEVSFVGNGGVVLSGTVVAPTPVADTSPVQPRAALIMLEGAGNRGRQELRPRAEALARLGIVTLIYDKRTVGYSLFHRDYSVLADDALAGLRLLRTRADVDPQRLGLWAQSEGAFVAPLAASRSTDVKFLIIVGAVGMTPGEQTAWAYGQFLHHADVSGSLVKTMQGKAVRTAIGAGLFAEANFDPLPAWRQVPQPVLGEWGELDRESLPVDSSRMIGEALRGGGNTRYTVRFVAGARHSLDLTSDGGFDRTHDLPPEFGEFEAAWINNLSSGGSATTGSVTTGSATTVGVTPPQDPAMPLKPLAWYESPWLQLAAIVLFLVAFGGYPLTAVIRRILGRRGAPAGGWSARWLSATGLLTTTVLLGYVFFMLATAANITGPVVLGRPVPWLILQLLAVGTVAATVATAWAWRRHHHELSGAGRVRLGLLVAAGVVFLPWAFTWGLLVA